MKFYPSIIMVIMLLSGCSQLGFKNKSNLNSKLVSATSNVHLGFNIDTSKRSVRIIVTALDSFLITKDDDLSENKFWLPSELNTYPYLDLYQIEKSKFGDYFYKPTLLELVPTFDSNIYVLKLAYIGYNNNSKRSYLKAIYNIVANVENNDVQFSRYLYFATKDWKSIESGNIKYHLSPQRELNENDVFNQLNDYNTFVSFFSIDTLKINYYSCVSPVELFQIKGFDYTYRQYIDSIGGLAEAGGVIFSANNSEYYSHELVHVFNNEKCPNGTNNFLDEGLATYLGGSSKYNFNWHQSKFIEFLSLNDTFNCAKHLDPFESIYYQVYTPINYMIAANICKYIIANYDKEKLFELLNSKMTTPEIFSNLGIKMDQIDSLIRSTAN